MGNDGSRNDESKAIKVLGLSISILALGGAIASYNLSQSAHELSGKSFDATKTTESIRLITDFEKTFNSEEVYRDFRTAIEACLPLYKSWGGPFGHDKVNRYLNFFESLGFMYKEELLSRELIDFYFGAYLVEAYAHPHVERYIRTFRENGQKDAFVKFESIAQEIRNTKKPRLELYQQFKTICLKELEGST